MNKEERVSVDPLWKRSEAAVWSGAGFLILLLIGCLALILVNFTQGFGPEGHKTTFWLEGAVSTTPNCAPHSECPAMIPADRNYLSVWFFHQLKEGNNLRINYYRIINLSLSP